MLGFNGYYSSLYNLSKLEIFMIQTTFLFNIPMKWIGALLIFVVGSKTVVILIEEINSNSFVHSH